jgi:hypothetical protein
VGKGTGLITACLGRELKAQLVEAVRNANTTQSRFVRQAIVLSLRSDGGRLRQALAVRTRNNEREIRVHAYLPQSVAEWYSAAARSAGATRTSYLRAELIEVAERASSPEGTTAPAPKAGTTGTLKEALVKSNAGLAAIERSVSQMTRALDAQPRQITPSDRESLAAIGRAVTEHLELVSRALQAIRAPRYRPSHRGTAPKLDRWP